VAVISHGGFYNNYMSALLGLAANDGYWFALHNTGVTRIDFRDDSVGLVFLNRVDFLPQELIT
jgi:2,3-bisphosphoglycerate-dependent phosphoglycerate mutase